MKEQIIKDTIEKLKKKYAFDSDVLENIEKAEKDIAYILTKERDPEYIGQSALGYLRMFEDNLEYWS